MEGNETENRRFETLTEVDPSLKRGQKRIRVCQLEKAGGADTELE
jgi:hypothetical protein